MSRARRFYAPELDSVPGRLSVELKGDEAHHIRDVLRLKPGASVELFDGRGRAVTGAVEALARGSVRVRVEGEAPSVESPLDLTIALAVPKPERMAFAIQKLTELGVRRIAPLVTEHSNRSGRAGRQTRLTRWRRIVLEATKQSGRSFLAEVSPEQELAELLAEARKTEASVFLAQPDAKPSGRIEASPDRPLLALIGPEGGWSEDELALAGEHGAVLLGLGPRVLRTETAAITAAALLQANLGDLR